MTELESVTTEIVNGQISALMITSPAHQELSNTSDESRRKSPGTNYKVDNGKEEKKGGAVINNGGEVPLLDIILRSLPFAAFICLAMVLIESPDWTTVTRTVVLVASVFCFALTIYVWFPKSGKRN